MPTRNINLTPHFDRFIEEEVNSGRYGSASEVVREGLRLVESRRKAEAAKLEQLRANVRVALEAVARGEYVDYSNDADLRKDIERLGKTAATAPARKRRVAQAARPAASAAVRAGKA